MDHNMVVTTSPDRMAQGVLGMEQVGDVDMSSAARKRSKVSRACDECRRKKVSMALARASSKGCVIDKARFAAMRQ